MQLRSEDVLIDTDSRQVLRGGQAVALSPKAFQLLTILAQARPKALSKDELHRALWPDTFVVEPNLSNLVGEIRAALRDSPRQSRFIRTVHGYGYAFCAETGASARWWLTCGPDVFPLCAGENIIGRGPEADVRLDATGVSRRHARILVDGEHVVVEDVGSKNGTFVGGERINAPRRLLANDELGVGSVRARLTSAPPDAATQTV
jgi:DNA-binding winged helix-turn-helix (wHTH) protein